MWGCRHKAQALNCSYTVYREEKRGDRIRYRGEPVVAFACSGDVVYNESAASANRQNNKRSKLLWKHTGKTGIIECPGSQLKKNKNSFVFLFFHR